jgi:hypothetical protein
VLVTTQVDQADRYRQLALLGRDAFITAAAPAALVRRRLPDESTTSDRPLLVDDDDTLAAQTLGRRRAPADLEVYALMKKPGAPFADMITVGRTPNNDIVIRDVTVSRFHAFFKKRETRWVVADAGSKNGSAVDGQALEARKERDLASGTAVRFGEIHLTFYSAADLYGVLGGR